MNGQYPNRKVTIIGVLMDLGADRRGVDMGPSAIRVAGLNERWAGLGYEVTDAGNIGVRNPDMMQITDRKLKYLPEIAAACPTLASHVEAALEECAIRINLRAGRSTARGSVSGLAAYYHEHEHRVGVS